jgi:predicted NBD/HSP70 family sugar kinase
MPAEMNRNGDRITIGLDPAPQPRRAPPPGGGAGVTLSRLFAEVLTAGPMSRTELAHRSGLSQSTVTKLINPLVDAGYLVATGEIQAGLGRPRQLLDVAAGRYAAVGVKIAPGTITGVLTDLRAQILARTARPVRRHDPLSALAITASVVTELLAAGRVEDNPKVLGLGAGVGGHVDARSGRVISCGLLGWTDVDVAGPLSAATGLPVVMDNDVNALAIAERWFGASRGTSDFAIVTVGPGIGCGLLLGGELYTGATGLAGELGHVPVDPDGALCGCGNRGCLETVAADDAVLRAIAAQGGECADIDQAVALARGGDEVARQAFGRMGEMLGRALATVSNLLNPARIVLTGERAAAYDLFGHACENAWRAAAFSAAARDCSLVVEPPDDYVWARGAACMVIREAVAAPAD